MKIKCPLLIIAGFMLCLSACKKDLAANASNRSIVGTWFVNKLAIQQKITNTGAVADTTYTRSVFNSHDFFQFNNDSTASLSSSGDFELSGEAIVTDGSGNLIYGTNKFTYSLTGSALTLTSTFLHPTANLTNAGSATETVVLLDANNLTLLLTVQSTSSTITYKTYYTKGI